MLRLSARPAPEAESLALIESLGPDTYASLGARTDLGGDRVAVFDGAGRRQVGAYRHGAGARLPDDVDVCSRTVQELEPELPAAQLEDMRRISDLAVRVGTVLVDSGR